MEHLFKKILCPIDFSPLSAIALKKAAQLARIFYAQLIVAHVVNNPWSAIYAEKLEKARVADAKAHPDSPPKTYMDWNRGAPELAIISMSHQEVLKAVREMVQEFVEAQITDVTCEIYVKDAEHTYRAIIEFAAEQQVELIVMATHGRTGPTRLYFGSVAENIVRRSACSVLVVRE